MLKKLTSVRTQQEIPNDNSACAIFLKLKKNSCRWLAEENLGTKNSTETIRLLARDFYELIVNSAPLASEKSRTNILIVR